MIRKNKPEKFSSGAKNLILLGVGSTLIATVTTAVSLFLYHDSGDIYLDRSRPGFLPDEKETKEEIDENKDYSFPDSGSITEKDLDEYLKNLDLEFKRIESYSADPFSLDSLSDESLGL
ncbi:hypothetical protein IJG21_02630 [Candidatus Saccharibacteria bacterium]|nr:hypothetical protein [Candidatus Saccharibacteria bacterium]